MKPESKYRFYLILPMLAGGYATVATGSRTAFLFIPVIIVTLLLLFRKQLSRKAWAIITGVLVLLIVILTLQQNRVVGGFTRGLEEIEKYQQDSSVYSSWGARLNMWYNSWQVFKTAPVLGTGVGDYHVDVKKLLKKGITRADGFSEEQTNAHSIYFETLAEGGIIGIALLLTCLFILPSRFFYRYWKNAISNEVRSYSLAGLIIVVAFAWFGLTEGWLNRNPMVNSYALLLVVFMTSLANKVKPIGNNIS
jgi:O-antigen ligase